MGFFKRLNVLCFVLFVIASLGVAGFAVNHYIEKGGTLERLRAELRNDETEFDKLDLIPQSLAERVESTRDRIEYLEGYQREALLLGGACLFAPLAYMLLVNGVLGWLLTGRFSLGFRLQKAPAAV